ncbi:MAG: hypothetical protein HUK40_09690 [Desulfobacter sp.]|nr:hypothetical protein [Desulfobacter sp.]WDP84348.1 MAG: hypothetical protein HUN05_03575 [Desulfobacter sp.]
MITPVFIDASSAILLFKADLFIPCTQAYHLIMARKVFQEVRIKGYPGAQFFGTMKTQNKVQVQTPGKMTFPIPLKGMGEQQTLALYHQQTGTPSGAFVIMDDGKGAKCCRHQNIPYINALLVPKILWYSRRMDEKMYLEKQTALIELGRYSQTIIEKAKALSHEDLAYFIPNEKNHHPL